MFTGSQPEFTDHQSYLGIKNSLGKFLIQQLWNGAEEAVFLTSITGGSYDQTRRMLFQTISTYSSSRVENYRWEGCYNTPTWYTS